MENFNHSLPGIAQIGYCLCENIQPNIVLKHSSGIPVGVFTEITPVRFFGQPSYEAVEEYDKYDNWILELVANDVYGEPQYYIRVRDINYDNRNALFGEFDDI